MHLGCAMPPCEGAQNGSGLLRLASSDSISVVCARCAWALNGICDISHSLSLATCALALHSDGEVTTVGTAVSARATATVGVCACYQLI